MKWNIAFSAIIVFGACAPSRPPILTGLTQCAVDNDCASGASNPECISATCSAGSCVYSARLNEPCGQLVCADASLTAYVCGADGACNVPAGPSQSCGFACADLSSCATSCTDNTQCPASDYCTAQHTCEPKLPDGAACTGTECASAHCDGGICCRDGNCCDDDDDCAAFAGGEKCLVRGPQTTCQGARRVGACVEHVCRQVVIDDDTACDPERKKCPGNLAPVSCTAADNQEEPTCPAACEGSGQGGCRSGYTCESGTCALLDNLGDACTSSCANGLICDNSICCQSGNCCNSNADCQGSAGLPCDLDTHECVTTCVPGDSSECHNPDNRYCNATGDACVQKLSAGSACDTDDMCLTGECVDGVCCNTACDGLCDACSTATGSDKPDGTCGGRTGPIFVACPFGQSCPSQPYDRCENGEPLLRNGEECEWGPNDPGCSAGAEHCERADPNDEDGIKRCSAVECGPCQYAKEDGSGCRNIPAGEQYTSCDDPGEACVSGECVNTGSCDPYLYDGTVCNQVAGSDYQCADGFLPRPGETVSGPVGSTLCNCTCVWIGN